MKNVPEFFFSLNTLVVEENLLLKKKKKMLETKDMTDKLEE